MTASSPAIASSAAADTLPDRLAIILRDIARGGLAGVIAGTLVGGLGGRVVMRIIALLNPGASGRFTENGEVVGAITLNGTLALMVFGGLASGLAAGFVWVAVSPWLPGRGRWRWVVGAGATVALGGSFIVRSSNTDFLVLRPDPLLIGLLLGLVAVFGAAVAGLDQWLELRLGRPAADPWPAIRRYGLIALLGTPAIPLVIGAYFSFEAGPHRPVFVGWALVVTGLATLAWWATRAGVGTTWTAPIRALGRIALAAAAVLGVVQLWSEIGRIVARG